MAADGASTTSDASSNPQPAATFLVRGIFVLGTRSLFIVRGTVVAGMARAKQRVMGLPGMDAEVQGVEANLLDINGGAAQSALTFHYAKQAELARWKTLVIEGTLLSLSEANAG
ncbi:MAG TPA: hypothetical protein VK617_04125 [Gemmatimonadaceae bacterium]|nr:hypothetical protein [Gemmatimonadaceae bacterium]